MPKKRIAISKRRTRTKPVPVPDFEDHVIHDHPVPAGELGKYSPIRNADSEQDIANYVSSQASEEAIQHVEKIKTEYVLGDPYEIWDVTTDQGRWWVITNMTNLYSQKHFPSLDYTLSFHVGLMMRLRSRPQAPDSDDPHPFDEVFRRQSQAKTQYERAVEAVDYQAIGMQLRECLISLIAATRRRTVTAEVTERPQDSNFIAWNELLINQLCRGPHNKDLRQYLKTTADKTWQLVNWLTHDRDANQTASSIAIHACDTLIGHHAQLIERDQTDNVETCPRCLSRDVRSHFDIHIEPDGAYYATCGQCNWSSHAAAGTSKQSDSEPS